MVLSGAEIQARLDAHPVGAGPENDRWIHSDLHVFDHVVRLFQALGQQDAGEVTRGVLVEADVHRVRQHAALDDAKDVDLADRPLFATRDDEVVGSFVVELVESVLEVLRGDGEAADLVELVVEDRRRRPSVEPSERNLAVYIRERGLGGAVGHGREPGGQDDRREAQEHESTRHEPLP